MWGTLGKWIGKGILWIARNPQALEAVETVIVAARKKKPVVAHDPDAGRPGPDGHP